MAYQQASITVEQFHDGDNYTYTVKQTTNTTNPKINQQLTEASVKDLIDQNYKVTIKPIS